MYEVKVYKIWWEDEPEEFYIGATKEKGLSYRMRNHRCRARKGGSSRIHSTMRRKGFDFKYIQLASCEVSNKDESNSFEQQWINKLKPTLNMKDAYINETTEKEKKRDYNMRPDVREKRDEYNRKYLLKLRKEKMEKTIKNLGPFYN